MVRRRAFTLIEVLTVLIVLTITVGIGYESLQSATQSSYSQVSQGYAHQVVNLEDAFYNQYETFTPYPTDLITNPPVTVTAGATSAATTISIAVGASTGDLSVAYIDGSGNCQLILTPPPISQAVPATSLPATTGESCTATLALGSESPITTSPGGSAK